MEHLVRKIAHTKPTPQDLLVASSADIGWLDSFEIDITPYMFGAMVEMISFQILRLAITQHIAKVALMFMDSLWKL